MRAVEVWADKLLSKDNTPTPIYCTVFRPDGTQLVLGAGNRVLVYETSDGENLGSIKGHKDTVYCVAYQKDMKRFASGDANKTVIIWNADTFEGILRYTHTEAIQCLAFNPVTHALASCTAADFGYWTAEAKQVAKYQVKDKVCCCSWTNDGRYIALGLYNGTVSIRDRQGEERVLITRKVEGATAPIWSVSWNPSEEALDTLAVCDWNQRLSFYMLSGRQISKDRILDYDPCCSSYFSSGDFLVVGGSDKQVHLYTKEGVKLHTICTQEGWVWSCAVRPRQNYVAVACSDGTIALYNLIFSTVHGLYSDKYAYRQLMTDVVLQDLTTEDETRIKCKDLVKKIAIYKNRLAVQLPKQIVVYDVPADGSKPKVLHKIREAFECNLLVVCSRNIIICQERRLQCFTFDGAIQREWTMDANIRYIKVTGGPPGREGLMVGLKNGQILNIFVDNPFPIELIKQGTPVRCLDISSSRRKLAVVDDQSTCLVYDLDTKELLFQEPHANSVAWNTQNENMLCFSGDGMLHIKASNFPLHKQKLQGFVVGFQGSSVYCLNVYAVASVEVPQSSSMHQYLNNNMFEEAYKIACLGVTDSDWRALGLAALRALNLNIAKNSFIRVHDVRYLELVNSILEMKKRPEYIEEDVLRAKVFAHQGEFARAAELYEQTGNRKMAMEMYSDLRQFEKAKLYLDEDDRDGAKSLMQKQTDWSKAAKDPAVMIDIYLHAGEVQQAVDLMGKNGMYQRLIDKARELNSGEMATLSLIASWLGKLDQVVLATEVYKKIGDDAGIAKLYISHEMWQEAFALAETNPELKENIYLPYADYLAENDRFEEAQDAFREAGHPDKAIKVLQVLTHNAVMENRFSDAGYYFWQLSMSVLDDLVQAHEAGEVIDRTVLAKFHDYQLRADVYYAYDSIHRYTIAPFTSHQPESLFNIARYLYHIPEANKFLGISQAAILYTLSRQAVILQAYNVARSTYEALLPLKMSATFREQTDLGAIKIRAKPFSDNAELLPLCYRCSTNNSLLNLKSGLKCANCGQPFVYSFHAFEVLPLIEFTVDDDIPDDEAVRLVNDDRGIGKVAGKGGGSGGGPDVMSLDDPAPASTSDAFTEQYMSFTPNDPHNPMVRADREMLQNLPSNEIFIQEWPAPLRNRYFRNVLPEIGVAMSESCNRFFHAEDYEHQVLQKSHCPYSRAKVEFKSVESDI